MKTKLNIKALSALVSFMMCCCVTATAQDDLSTLLVEGSLPATFENDPTYPWIVEDGVAISEYSEYAYPEYESSSITLTFESDKPTVFSCKFYKKYDYYEIGIVLIVDGFEQRYFGESYSSIVR